MNPIKLLLADPDTKFSKILSERLHQKGFLLTKAESLDELTNFLLEDWFHFVILNVNMTDPQNPLDTSGVKLLYDKRFVNVPKFVIANFPTVALTREVLRSPDKGIPLAVDFMGKDSEIAAIVESIQEAVEKHIRVNQNLVIRQNDATSILQLTQLIYSELSNVQLISYASELENLLRSIFFEARQITIGRLMLHKIGYAIVEMTFHGDETKKLLVTCRDPRKHYSEIIGPMDNGRQNWESDHASVHFDIKICNLQNAGRLISFPEYFESHNIPEVLETIQKLIENTFSREHNHQQQIEESDHLRQLVKDRLDLNINNLKKVINGICQAALLYENLQMSCDKRTITVHLKSGQKHVFPNPVLLVERNLIQEETLPIVCGLTYGKIIGSSIQIDNTGHSWIIDSSMVGFGPVMLDFAALEIIIRNECLEGIAIEDRIRLDEQLLDEKPDNNISPDLLKATESIRLLRNYNSSAPLTYCEVLLYALISNILDLEPGVEYTPNELVLHTHQLLLAAMILGRLLKNDKVPLAALDGLWIDLDSREVWVEGKRITLTPQDLDILIYLYKHAGEQRSRQMIIDDAMNNLDPSSNNGQGDPSLFYEESRINSAMSRLRLKIERDPENPKYLHTVRGLGYRLDI